MKSRSVVHSRNVGVARIRRCVRCSKPLARRARGDAKYCSATCRVAHWHKRARTALAVARKCAVCRKRLPLGQRLGARFCSVACRQRAYRRRKAAAAPSKANLRLIKDKHAAADGCSLLPPDICSAVIRPIPLATAAEIIGRFEPMPAVARYSFGIFFADSCEGVVVYGDEYGENLGVWDAYGYRGKIIALLRGACTHRAPLHAASKLVRRSMKLLPAHFQIVTATVDGTLGEVGTIYQACGFDFVGVMRQGGRSLIRINGKHVSERQAGRLAGTRGARALAALGFDAVPVPRRGRYFAFRGSKHDQRRNRDAIAHLVLPYPKRSTEA